MTIDQAALDTVITENFAGDWDIFSETARCFLESLEENITALKAASAAGSVEEMVKSSHRLKGETSLFHDPVVHGYFKDMEAEARKGALPSKQALDHAEQGVRGLADELRTILASRAA